MPSSIPTSYTVDISVYPFWLVFLAYKANSFNLWAKIQWMSLVIPTDYIKNPLGMKVQFQEKLPDVTWLVV